MPFKKKKRPIPFKKKKGKDHKHNRSLKQREDHFKIEKWKVCIYKDGTGTNPWRLLAWGDVGTNFQARKSQKWNYKEVLKVWGLIWVQKIPLFKNTRFNLPLQTSLENPMALPKGPLFKVSWSYLLLFRNKNIAYESPGAQSPRGEAKEINFLFWILLDSGFQFCDLISSKPWLQLTSLFSLQRA